MPVMSALLRRLTRSRDQRGGTMPIVAILFSTGVITGMAALTMDVGQLTFERRSLQNGADAAVSALAETCARDLTKCNSSTPRSDLDSLLDQNVYDGTAQLDKRADAICGVRVTGATGLPTCSNAGSNTNLLECPPWPASLSTALPYVQVYSRTDSGGGNTVLPPLFAQVFSGAPASAGACARAAWGTPSNASASVPIMLSACEWQTATTSGGLYPQPPVGKPGYGGAGQPVWPGKTTEVGIGLHKAGDAKDHCIYSGKDRPGGFGWAAATASTCKATVSDGNWLQVDTGNNADGSCKTVLDANLGTVILLPVFDCVSRTPLTGASSTWTACDTGNGANTYYHVAGWSAFYLTGYTIPSGKADSILPGSRNPCAGTNGCLSGWFVKGTMTASDIVPPTPGTNFGVVAIKLAG